MRAVRFLILGVTLLSASAALAFDTIELKDPKGDDFGPGGYAYPTHAVYTLGSFDMLSMTVEDAGDDIKFQIKIRARIEDPWDSSSWRGKGWSLQMFQIYVDTDHKPKSGFEKALPGMNVKFQAESWWEKVIVVNPQPDSRITAEVSAKAGKLGAGVVLPRKVKARGKTFTFYVRKKDLGVPQAGWGWQVLAQSNEGYPAKNAILARKVNEYNGEHRFGGGSDYDCDPHVLDLFVAPAKGGDAEKAAQKKALAFKCDPANPEDISGQAVIPMVYPK